METNQNPVQEYPANTTNIDTTKQIEQKDHVGNPHAKLLYNPEEAAQIVRHLTCGGLMEPEYILLFGSLVGGTQHSEVAAYDLFVAVREMPECDWSQAKRILRYKMPVKHREISYANIYIMKLNHVDSKSNPFLFFAHSEGVVLYCRERHKFSRPKKQCDFASAYAAAKLHYDTYHSLGEEMIGLAQKSLKHNMRLAAIFAAQAAVYLYRSLYYVYHGEEFGCNDPVVMHERMRTLSAELMLLFDDSHTEHIPTLPRLRNYIHKAGYDVRFEAEYQKLKSDIEQVIKMDRIIDRKCKDRLNIYKQRCL